MTTTTPRKPSKDFPLFAHANGQWAKKVLGKLHYFGKWDNPQAAIEEWLRVKDELLAGRKPRPKGGGGLTVRDLCNGFLTAKQQQRDAGELSPRTWNDYHATAEMLIDEFGKQRIVEDLRADDFEKLRAKMTKRWGPVRVGNVIQYVRTLFNYGYEAELLKVPLRFGPQFRKPSRKTLRKAKSEKGVKLFAAADLKKLVEAAGVPLKAMILLGINCGFGNGDVGRVPLTAVDLDAGWVNFPRPKTGISRRCKLWPETVEALRAVIAKRPTAKSEADAGLLFITKYGDSWHKDDSDEPVGKEFAKLTKTAGIERGTFYWLRHTFRTVAGGAKDEPAASSIMGHADESMAANYTQTIEDTRLEAVANHVHSWLYADADKDKEKPAKTAKPKRAAKTTKDKIKAKG